MPRNPVSHPDDIEERDGEFEVTATFESLYTGVCTLDNTHAIKRGSRVGKVRDIHNPTIVVPGVACATCTKTLPRARR